MNRILIGLACMLAGFELHAQIDGDALFSTDQIIAVELTFSQTNFWDSLQYYYDTKTYMSADLVLTDADGEHSFPNIGIRLKGNSSYSHPGNKKSFKIDFNRYVTGQQYDGLKKLNFSNNFKDPSCMREKVFFDIAQSVGVPAPRANYANVYFNGELWGFYTVVEQIDDQFLDWRIGDDDGNLFKAGSNFGGMGGGGNDAADLVYYGTSQSSYEDRYELKTNEDINDWTDLIELIDFINNSSDTEFETELANNLEIDEFLRSLALDIAFANLDAYVGSARNYYIYHNLSSDKWEWVKWDGNEAFGSYAQGVGNVNTLAINYHDSPRPLVERIYESDVLYEQYIAHMCDIIEQWFNPDYLDARIDEVKVLIQESVYADDNKMYSNANFETNVESDVGMIPGLKSLVLQRFNYISGQIDCTVAVSDPERPDNSLILVPNPAQDVLVVQCPSGGMERIRIFDMRGLLILDQSVNSLQNILLDVSFFAPGMYMVSVEGAGELNTSRLVVE